MKRWALLTIGLYVLVLYLIAPFFFLALFAGDIGWCEALFMYSDLDGALIFSLVMLGLALFQAALLVVPVRVASRRPVTKRWIVWPILAGALLLAIQMAALVLAANEVFEHASTDMWILAMVGAGCLWAFWAVVFWLYAWRTSKSLMGRLVNFLLIGSVLEILIAVPAHIYARARHECCAGFLTMWGLAAGLSIGLLAFGPAVFALFARRVAIIRNGGAVQDQP